ncbi:hypothetical protein K1T71_013519 [Dendrolimus kikuchii]|uniref:Uncharacterized protein n=1 Tax=Dendrolimus kikuchii TaxID=765133 RepID=A0ACC1CGP4_9NEOP|nr:hypothetical protein K1T71_013519 [Dendrolimus kikuchii]
MAVAITQKELVLVWKKETFLNLGLLNRLQPMSCELSRLTFKENILEKPTQNFLYHLCYYLVSILDEQVSNTFTWPLYDTKTEKVFRNELARFINDYSNKGLLSSVLSSYLVNPSSFKVVKLFYQMSQLAVQKLLLANMKTDNHKQLYNGMTEKYKSKHKDGFIEEINQTTKAMLNKYSNYMKKCKIIEKMAELFRNKITQMEEKLKSSRAIDYINDIIDNYVVTHDLDEATRAYIISIKNVDKPAKFFDDWLVCTDKVIEEMEETWSLKTKPVLNTAQATFDNTKTVISRYTGEMDKSAYMIEYNPKIDVICTKELENQVNSEQKYILKNIIRDDCLSFPNLVRGFLIAISFILKNIEIDDDIYRFNECMDNGLKVYEDHVSTLQELLIRIMKAEAKLQATTPFISPANNHLKSVFEIPDLPDLSDILNHKHHQNQISFNTFTPLKTAKHQFNLLRRPNSAFSKTRSRSLLAAPLYQAPQQGYKSLISCPANSYDRLNMTQDFHNLSIVPKIDKANETMAECGTGFTKQQIIRLLSAKKTSSSKKYKHKTKRPDAKLQATLFAEHNTSNESKGLFRSYSSPDLFENRQRKTYGTLNKRRLSIMPENFLEVSGIAALDSKDSTPRVIAESSREIEGFNMPAIVLTPCKEAKINIVLQEMEKELEIKDDLKSQCIEKTETPKTNPPIIKKTNSLEKIIQRFRKIVSNENNVQEVKVKKILLPDLLSPSCSTHLENTDCMDQMFMDIDKRLDKTSRQSLGAALGVDNTFLDQFDFVD